MTKKPQFSCKPIWISTEKLYFSLYIYVCMCIFLKAFSKDCPVHLAHQAHIPSFLVCLSSKTFHIFLWHDGATVTLHCCLVFQPLSFGSRRIFMSLAHRRQFLTTFCSCNKMNVWWNIVWFYEGSLDLEDKCKSCLFLWKKWPFFEPILRAVSSTDPYP